ncbi:hypothetical protein DFH94DRAFT_718501 [Russula ochroleuca]|jgi:pentatricopeptide repeat protein|uniref:Pentatricopeptide repeat-containing protein n=1 Tax=Russula ochroleuca TaxID=152965 RepID=A0A9P5N2W5_9AGAM|nr:hypothetical protein DFH94DRAFT_718501 [Russula ochroleuca]
MLHALPRCTRLRWQPKFTRGISGFLHPQLIRLFTPRHRPRPQSKALPPNDAAAKRPQWSRVIQTIIRIRLLLKRGKDEEAVENFQSCNSKIPSGSEGRIFRFALYERGITTFLSHRRFEHALELHQEMSSSGFYGSSGLRARMLVCSSIVKAPQEQQQTLETLFDELSPIISLPSYSQRSLCELLDDMKSHPLIESLFISKLVDRHLDSRESTYKLELNTVNKLVLFYMHVGNPDAAERLVVSHQDSSPVRRNPGPYTTLISSHVKGGTLSYSRLNYLMDKMKKSQVPIDLPFLNVLIQWAVRNGNVHQAFSLYETILRDNASHMIPDSYVFGSLFNAHQSVLSRNPSVRRARLPRNAPMPRQLFRQMLECQVLAVKAADPRTQRVVRVETLNVALRLFMLSMDYPAAFVTLRTFYGLGLRPDVRSYRFVITILLGQIQYSLQKAEKVRWGRLAGWADNFLGGSHTAAQAMGAQQQPEVASALLEFAGGTNTGYRTPTIAAIMGDEEPPEKAEWDVEPLERLVAKAILASLVPRSVSREQAERALREKMAPYFLEMVPQKLSIGRRLQRARY